jgi:hypothetical protein
VQGENFSSEENEAKRGKSAAGSMVGANILSRRGLGSDYGLRWLGIKEQRTKA